MGSFDFLQYAGKALPVIGENGALLITGKGGRNVMTMSWCGQAVIWNKNVVIAPVRLSRYSHVMLDGHKEFTVFVPYEGFKKELGVCGSKSGRDIDKFAACGLTRVPAKTTDVPSVAGKGIVYECRVIYEADLVDNALHPEVADKYYSGGDKGNVHTLYFGEITAVYET